MLRLVPVLLSLLLLAWPVSAEQKASQAQLKKLNQQIKTLQNRLRNNQTQLQQHGTALRKSDTRISNLGRELAQLDGQLGSLSNNAEKLEKQRDQLRSELNAHAQRINLQIMQQHRLGNQPRLEMLLNLRSPDDLTRQLRYFDNVNKALADQMITFRQQLAALGSTESALDSNTQAMVDKRAELAAQREKLTAARSKRKETLARLKKRISKDRKTLSSLKLDQQRMAKLLKDLKRSLDLSQLASNDKAFKELKGKLNWPLRGKIKRGFGNKRDGIAYDGMWIAGNTGTAVKAIHHGRVAFADWLRGYGMVLIIDHGSGYMSLYGYNQSVLRAPGDWVSAGETIATVGQSGGHAEPGLYFAIRYKGRANNPKRWLSRR